MRRAHRELVVWQEAMKLVGQVYELTKGFPGDERYGLSAQMRRAAISIPSNIAEGAARASRKEFAQFLSVARGSLSEIDTQVDIALSLELIADAEAIRIRVDRIHALLIGLQKSLATKRWWWDSPRSHLLTFSPSHLLTFSRP